MKIVIQYAGTNSDGDTPSHVMLSADAVWHAGMRVAWVRWAVYPQDGLNEAMYGQWEPVVPGKAFIDRRPGKLG